MRCRDRFVSSVAVLVALLLLLAHADFPVPRFTVDLDLPPEERWADISRIYSEKLSRLMQAMVKHMPPLANEMLAIAAADILKNTPEPYRSEIMGIAKYTNLSPGSIMLFNMVYELNTFRQARDDVTKGNIVDGCTSIVVQNLADKILHGRNLDWSQIRLLQEASITVDFQKAGRTLYTGSTVAGYVGLVTGQKPNKFTVSLDQRAQGNWTLNAMMATNVGTTGVVSFLIRSVLADPSSDFESAVKTFSSAPLIAPSYFIVGGVQPGEGVVVTRNRNSTALVLQLNVSHGRWYVLETNYDSWKPPPPSDDRRDAAIKALLKVGRTNINPQTLYRVLSTPLVLNNSTVMTVIMSASQPEIYKAVIRRK